MKWISKYKNEGLKELENKRQKGNIRNISLRRKNFLKVFEEKQIKVK